MKTMFLLPCISIFTFVDALSNYRLSNEVIPNHYSIKIRPEIDNEVFFGEVTIYVRTKNFVENVTLHSSNLNITEVLINHREGILQFEEHEKISIRYANGSIQPGEHVLHIKYSGRLAEGYYGFIKAPYGQSDSGGFLLVTELQPIGARKAFPCFDEPSFKAKFNVRLVAPNSSYRAISNMPEVNKFTTSHGVVYDFATSVMMSTYLVSFAITEYPYYEQILENDGRKIPIRIYTVNASEENNGFAINCSIQALQFYGEYTNISYPLPKLDMIEFNRTKSSATENWGLITFKQGLLSPSLNVYSKSQIQLVMYHEISHFWFGNLVTNDWWSDIWLQEGFATYMSYKLSAKQSGVEQIEEMKAFSFDGFFETDVVKTSRPVVNYLTYNEEIFTTFDNIVYDKGAGILLMIESIIGEDKFKKVVQTFLKRHSYRTATTNDFISAIEDIVDDMSLRSFIESYIYQDRFPLITVNGDNGMFVLKQQVCGTGAKLSSSGQKWTIPVTYITDKESSNVKLVWFDQDSESLKIEEPGIKWVLFNSKGVGIYKVNFSESLWKTLTQHFEEMDISQSSTLVSDAYYSYRFNLINCDVLLNLMRHTRNRKKWVSFFYFHEIILDRLKCNSYTEELNIYMKFLQKKFNETDYHKKLTVNDMSCEELDGKLDEEELTNLSKCALWIKDNLSAEDNALI